MRNLYLAFFFIFSFAQAATAQKYNSVVADSASHRPLPGASVMISGRADTVLVTGDNGRFNLGRFPAGDYTLQVSYLGYPTHRTYFSIAPGHYEQLPDTFFMTGRHAQDLKEVVIKNEGPAVSMNGDTVEYNAARFKVKEGAVVEDLLQKLPGVRVQRDGSIKTQGETVGRVLVDGKEFFGGDLAIATKNLPADMIKKVQVYDRKSDLAMFTGVDDGNTVKTINLITKKGLKKGLFGNVSGGIGNNERYEAGVNINGFQGDNQLSLLAKANNVNKSGFTGGELFQMLMKNPNALSNLPPAAMSELFKMKGVKIDGGASMASLMRPSGFTDTRFGGLNFNNTLGKKTQLHSSYFYTGSDTKNTFSQDRQNFLADTAYGYQQSGVGHNRSDEHRVEFTADVKLNNKNTLKVSPRFNYATGNGNEYKSFSSRSADGKTLLNEGVQSTSNNSYNTRIGADILYGHKFKKLRRSLALTMAPEYYNSHYTSLNQSLGRYYNLGSSDSVNQQTTGHSISKNINGKLTYTEPLGKKLSLQLSGEWRYDKNDASRLVKDYDDIKGGYEVVNERYSDVYTNTTHKFRPDAALAAKYKKLEFTAGTAWEQYQLNGRSDMKGYRVHKRAGAPLPHLYAQYKLTERQKLTFNYNTSASMPDMTQLQPLEDNSDVMVTRRGNPDLEMETGQQLSLSWNNATKDFGRSQYLRLNFGLTRNRITNQVLIDPATARQLVYPVNVNGNYNGSVNTGLSFQTDKDGSSLNLDLGLNYNKSRSYSNGLPVNTRTWSLSPEINYNQYIGKNISLNFKGSYSYNDRQFDRQMNQPRQSGNINYSFNPLVTLPAGITLEANWDNYVTTGLSAGFNTTVSLLNASFTKTLGRSFSLSLEGRDLLNQNKSVQRISGDGYIEDRRNDLLGRYAMLSFIYKLKYFSK